MQEENDPKYTGHKQQLQRVAHDFARNCIKQTTLQNPAFVLRTF